MTKLKHKHKKNKITAAGMSFLLFLLPLIQIVMGGSTAVAATPQWEPISGYGEIVTPQGIAIDSAGNVYVSNGIEIEELSSASGKWTTVTTTGLLDHYNDRTKSVAVDSANNLYVTIYNDFTSRGKIKKLKNGAKQWEDITGSATFNNISGSGSGTIAVDSTGNVYVTDTIYGLVGNTWTATGVVKKLPSGGSTWTDIAIAGGYGYGTAPGLAIDSADNVYVTVNGTNGRSAAISKLSSQDNTWTDITGTGFVVSPNSLAVDGSGNVYVTDRRGFIKKLSSVDSAWTDITYNLSYGYIQDPQYVAADSTGNVYVTDYVGGIVYKLSNGTPAPDLPATSSPGTVLGTTKVTATAGAGHHLAIKVSSSIIAKPNVGDAGPTGAGVTNPYTTGSDLSGVDTTTNKYVGVYELDSNNKVVSFRLITLTGSDITPSTPAPDLPATPSPGTVPGTTKVTVSAGANNHLAIKVSSSIIAKPNTGDVAPKGAGVTNPYTAGSDLSGVDTTTNKYVGVYEVDSNNKVVSFKLITLTGGDVIPSAPATIIGLLVDQGGGVLSVGDTQTVVTKAVYSDQSIRSVTGSVYYTTSDSTIATVDSNGMITANAPGTVTITISSGGKTVPVTIVVQNGRPQIMLSLEASPASVVGDGSSQVTLKAAVVSLSGSPVADVLVSFQGTGNSISSAITDSQGIATATFTAPSIGVIPTYDIITATATEPNTGLLSEENITVHYMPASVKGMLIDKVTGNPMEGTIVSVTADFNGDGIVDFSQEVTTGADGSYQICVPRGNWNYTLNIQTRIQIGNQFVTLNRTQTAQVGTLTGTGQSFASANTISAQLLISNSAANNSNPQPTLDSLFGTGNVNAIVRTGGNFVAQFSLDANGKFDIENVTQGQYSISYQIKAPDGTVLAGPAATVNVNGNGEMSVVNSLIDPYGIVTDATTGQPVSGVNMSLYWADTLLNRQNGHTPNTLVKLPELPSFAPNLNHNPQVTDAAGEYAWMVFPNADYYIVATRKGYDSYSTLTAKPNVPAANGSDSYIQNGIIHVGQNLVSFSFSIPEHHSSSSSSSGGGVSNNTPTGLTTSNITQTGVTLSWHAVTGVSSYNIYDNGKLIASGIKGTGYKVTGLAAGTNHNFTLTAIVNGTESQHSTSQTMTTAADASLPEQTGHHEKYMEGYPDDTFKPERNVTREEVAMILYRVYHLSAAAMSDMNYSDVSKDDWSSSAIAAVTKIGFMNGYPDGTFLPTQFITREEMAMVVTRLKQLQGIETDAFSDISGSWARDAINSANQAGILKGYADGTFHPNSNTTRAEAVIIMNRLLNRGPLTGVDTPKWSDVSPNYWAYADIEEASTDHHYIIQDKTERQKD